MTGIIIVQPFTQVVVLRFGKKQRTIEDNGLGYTSSRWGASCTGSRARS
ncbi:MAG: hypothetical protein IPI67_17885 [Myxococcales bacterium]|nr:hypothetical protein [Myxococcales bacterium]